MSRLPDAPAGGVTEAARVRSSLKDEPGRRVRRRSPEWYRTPIDWVGSRLPVLGQVVEVVTVQGVDRLVGHALGDAEHAGEHDLDELAELLLTPVVGLAADLEEDGAGAVECERGACLAGEVAVEVVPVGDLLVEVAADPAPKNGDVSALP